MRIRDGSSVVFSSDLGHLYHSAAIPALENISSPSSFIAPSSFARTFFRRSKLSHTSFQFPLVAALLYSVARVSKKLACSTPFNSEIGRASCRERVCQYV